MQNNRSKLLTLFFTLVVIMLGFGMVIPILPFYIKSFGVGGKSLGILMSVYAVMQLIFSPVWGKISDRVGRKPILMVGIFGNAVAQLLFGLSTNYEMLVTSRALAGILSSATLPTAMAYIGDTTTSDERSRGMGVLGAAMGVGMVFGPGVAGYLAKFSLSTPFFLASGLSLAALVLVYFILPESLSEEERAKELSVGLIRQFTDMFSALFSPIGVLLFFSFFLSFGMTNFESIFGLFSIDKFNYDTIRVGFLLTILGVLSALVQGFLTGPLSKWLGDVPLIRVSIYGSSIGFILMLWADNDLQLILSIGFFIIFLALLRPILASLISRRTKGGQGTAMGLNNAFMSLGRVIGPLWAGSVYDINISLPYLSGSIIMLIAFIVSLFWLKSGEVAGIGDNSSSIDV